MKEKIILVLLGLILLTGSGFLTYYLLKRDKEPEIVDQYSEEEKADIYHLIINGNIDDYRMYLDDGKKLSFAFSNNKTPLELLIEQNDILSAAKLMENGFDLKLVKNNHIDTVTAVLAHNELIQFEAVDQIAVQLVEQIKDEIENEDSFGYSLLISAVETNNVVLVEEVLKYIYDVDKIYNGESALNFACLSGETDLAIIELLLDSGANVNLQTNGGNSCLMNAMLYEQPELIHYLLTETDVFVNLKNNAGQTALHIAVLYSNFTGIDYLLELSFIDKNIIDNEGKTAKNYAIELSNMYPEYEEYINKL